MYGMTPYGYGAYGAQMGHDMGMYGSAYGHMAYAQAGHAQMQGHYGQGASASHLAHPQAQHQAQTGPTYTEDGTQSLEELVNEQNTKFVNRNMDTFECSWQWMGDNVPVSSAHPHGE